MESKKDLDIMRHPGFSRRAFLGTAMLAGAGALCFPMLLRRWKARRMHAQAVVAKAGDYSANISEIIRSGLLELGILPEEIKGNRFMLKPNLVETHPGSVHINTHPSVVHAAAEAFMSFGALEVLVAEGPGHCRDSLLLLEESGLAEMLVEDRLRFIDLNFDQCYTVANKGGRSRLNQLFLPETLKQVDMIVSMAKMKTHHWVGVTLSMKNLFGIMPGSYYGWPKNVLHWAGINETILDINATAHPHLAIVDGIVGMEGDGPIMGTPRHAGVLVMGRNFPAVDATCARIMGINPCKVPCLAAADGWLGPIRESHITQRGESITSVQTTFRLVDTIPAHRGIRL
jgi:uncharacterized protein (DUF362 family)